MVRWHSQKMQDHTQRAKILSLFLLFLPDWICKIPIPPRMVDDQRASGPGVVNREKERRITVLENAQVCSTKKKNFGNFLKPNVQETSTFIIQREWCENTPPPLWVLLSIKKKKRWIRPYEQEKVVHATWLRKDLKGNKRERRLKNEQSVRLNAFTHLFSRRKNKAWTFLNFKEKENENQSLVMKKKKTPIVWSRAFGTDLSSWSNKG